MGTYNDENNGQNNAEDEMKQAIGAAKEAKKITDDAYRTAKKAGKLIGKISSVITFIITNFVTILQIIGISLIAIIAINCFQYIVELITAQNTPEQIYETLGVTDIKELVEIVGNESKGYHLEYVDDIDKKIDQIIDVLGSKSGVYTINSKDSDLIKKMIKAEVITQFPNLAGEYDEGNEEFQGAIKIRRITPNKEIGEMKNTGTGEVTTLGDKDQDAIIKEENVSEKEDRFFNSSGRETIGDENRLYVIAIAAGHNNTDDKGVTVSEEFVEEEMTIKVAEKVEEICKKYRNLIVVQTGSTTENPGGVSKEERVTLAKEANPDLCIQIHFNSGEGYGVETCYEYGDGYSSTLAQIVSDQLAEKMGLENRGAITNENNSDYYETIDSYYQTNFPSIITKGGFLDNSNDQEVLRNGGIDKYAEAIVDGCIEYLRTDHSNESVTFVQDSMQTSGIDSRVYDLKYVPEAEFKLLVEVNSEEALKYFTLDESFNVVTASWSKEGNNSLDIISNAPFNLRSTLQNVTMPYEYLLYFLIDSGNKEFVRDFADLVADTEIIMAVQDNITTTEIKAIVQQRTNASVDEKDTDWKEVTSRSSEESSFMELCRTSISITYADTWFVRYTKAGDSYSANSLGVQKDDLVDKIVNVRGTVTEQTSVEEKGYGDEGPYSISERKTETYKKLKEINQYYDAVSGELKKEEIYEDITYTYFTEERYKKTIYTISNSYEEGEAVIQENINKFVNLYNKYKMANCVKEKWLFKILESNTKTVNMVDLTKYLIYKATGTSYGIEEFDFSEYAINEFNNLNGNFGDWNGGTHEEFIQAVAPYAVIDMEQHGIYASVTIAQAILESGWGMDNIALTYKNFFGMKAKGSPNEYWSGESVALEASEGGISSFKVYDSLKNSVYDHGRNFHVTSTYAEHGVLECMSQNLGPQEQLNRIAASGYAVYADGTVARPDGVRTYGQFLYEEFIVKYDLEKYDSMTSADFEWMSNNGAQKVVELAKSKLGCEYEWGKEGPNTFDCSGLVYWIYKTNLGISVPRTTSGYESTYKGTDKELSMNEIQPGDILLTSSHAGIYIGNNEYIHAPEPGDVVKISSGAKENFTYAVRMITGNETATEMQQKIVNIASSKDTLDCKAGYCQAWVANVYNAAGQSRISSCCATTAGNKWIVSTDKSNIPLGACVYGYSNPYVSDSCGYDAGHVGIYIGNGQVASNVGGIRIESLDSWIKSFKWRGWGWNGGIDYSK